MTTNNARTLMSVEVVERYLSFFRTRGHAELPGSPIVVPGSSTSFIIAGMQPMLPYLRGQEQPPVPRLTSFQRCLRTDDADAVGINGKKLTCFHMRHCGFLSFTSRSCSRAYKASCKETLKYAT